MADYPRGLHLGYFYDDKTERAGNRRIYQGTTHALIFGPSGTGKTTRLLMVNLLSDCLDDRSIIVVDPKGELAAVTAWHRFNTLGHDVKILDPFGKLNEVIKNSPAHRRLIESGLARSVGFNPLDALLPPDPAKGNDFGSNFYDDAAALSEALIEIKGQDPHWTESAQGLMTGLIMWEKMRQVGTGRPASLDNVRDLLTVDEYENGKLVRGLQKTAEQMVKRSGSQIASLAGRFTAENDEMASIRSAADTQTRWILSKRMQDDLRTDPTHRPGIDFAELKNKPTTVYVILPAERMRTHSVWLRLVIVSALRALYRPGGVRTFLLIDEMAALGHLGPLEDAFGLVRGYGIQIAGFLQDLGQLKALYKERHESFMANAGVVHCFSANDLTTADWMSRRSGQTTVLADSINMGTSASPGGRSENEGLSTGQISRPRFLPYDVMGFGEGMGLYWLAGLKESVRFFAPPYWKIDECERRALPNPYAPG
jgi:type IV secretion system protein VirD4